MNTRAFGIMSVITPGIYFTNLWWFLPPTNYEERTRSIQRSIVALLLCVQLCHCLPIGAFVCWRHIQSHKRLILHPGQRACVCEQGQRSVKAGSVVTQLKWLRFPYKYLPWWTVTVPTFPPSKDIPLTTGVFPPSTIKTFVLDLFVLPYVYQYVACMYVYMCITYMPWDSVNCHERAGN